MFLFTFSQLSWLTPHQKTHKKKNATKSVNKEVKLRWDRQCRSQMLIFAICQKAASACDCSGIHRILGDNDAILLHICLLFSKNDPPCECGCVHVCCVKTGAATAGGNRRQSPWTTSSLITAHPLIFISRQTDI